MGIQARNERNEQMFAGARAQFEEMVGRLEMVSIETLATTEEYLRIAGLELQRLLLQARLDILLERERVAWSGRRRPKGSVLRVLRRQVETTFGRVVERRHALKAPGEQSRFAMDAELNLASDLYSHALRRRVAEEVVHGSFDHAVAQIGSTTGGHVPKRQTQELVVRAAQDVDAFYASRGLPANDTLTAQALLAMSSDGCGIRMLSESLREPTRRAAAKAKETSEEPRGDPTGKAPVASHQVRRALVTAVWSQERHQRTADDVIANLLRHPEPERRKSARGPRPQSKRVSASVKEDQRQQITEMFDEADRRDPERRQRTVVLVDGDEHQTTAILQEGLQRGRPLTLVLDLLHAMHYLWVAAMAITARRKAEAEELVVRWTLLLLTGNPAHVVAAVRRTATLRGIRGEPRKAVDGAANYLLKRTPFIHYARFIPEGLPIASGVIEGACRHIVRDRMDITGARWALDDAEAVLKLRAVQTSGDWNDYWAFHLQQEAHRNYPKAA